MHMCVSISPWNVNFISFFNFIYFVYFACKYVCALCECLASKEAGEGVRCPKTGMAGNCELPCGCRTLNLGPL